MADKRISQLVERTDIANNDVLPIVASGATTTNKVTVSTLQDWMQENLDVGVTSVGLSMPSAFTVTNSPVTTSGNISVVGAGTVSQYIRGDGSLADFPQSSGGGGASVSYYLNGSVSQGTIGGIAYREMNKTPILGAGTDFTISSNGYIASFITDAGDPSLLLIPGGNWNFETYFQASSGGGTPSFYVELYKVDSGGTATLIASNSANPELIAFGTTTTAYFSSLAVPSTTLTLTDRLALRYYVTPAGRTITLHTENSNLCQIITTFTTGLTALNGLTAQVQNFATGTSGTDFNIVSSTSTHTFNLPNASATARGVVTTGTQTFAGYKIFNGTIGANVDIQLATQGTALNTFIKNINATGQTSIGSNGFGFNNANNIYFSGSSKGGGIIAFNNTGNQTYTLQNASGTLAFTSDLGAYLPLTGGTLTGALNGTSAVFSGDVQSGTRLIAAASSQSIILTPNSGGTTNRVESVGTLPLALVSAAAITMAAGGTTPQITLATSGNLGVNNSSPAERLVVGGAIMSTGGITGHGANRTTISQEGSSGAFWQSYGANSSTVGTFVLRQASSDFSITRTPLSIDTTGAATFSSSVDASRFFSIGSLNNTNGSFGIDHPGIQSWKIGITNANTSTFSIGNDNGGAFATKILNITNSGNVGIGTASPGVKLQVESTINSTYSPSDTLNGGVVAYIKNPSTTNSTDATIRLEAVGSASVAATSISAVHTGNGSSDLTFGTRLNAGNVTERMRITSSGYLKAANSGSYISVGANYHEFSNSNGGTVTMYLRSHGSVNGSGILSTTPLADTSEYFFGGNSDGVSRVRIYTNGNIQNQNNSYGSLSDIKLKENIEDATPKLDDLLKVKVRNYNLIGSEIKQIGVIAQELEEVFPAMIDESEDFEEVEVPQLDEEGNEILNEEGEVVTTIERVSKGTTTKSVKYSVFVPMLIKAIQELKAEIDSLKTK